ncbi:hypothetical protein [Anaerobacillus alkaliphilus]|nr:hypothetical protein [Anaerobacillus alkaliphilus]
MKHTQQPIYYNGDSINKVKLIESKNGCIIKPENVVQTLKYPYFPCLK